MVAFGGLVALCLRGPILEGLQLFLPGKTQLEASTSDGQPGWLLARFSSKKCSRLFEIFFFMFFFL